MFGSVCLSIQVASSFRKGPVPFDALIASTAMAHDLPLYTRNPDDFAGIPGLLVREVDTSA